MASHGIFCWKPASTPTTAANWCTAAACYGADADSLVTQVNNLGLVEGVAALQVQYAEDSDGDSFADRWVGAGQWQSEDRLTGVRVSLLLASPFPVGGTQPRRFQLLDELVDVPADGRLRRAFHSAAAIRGRLK